MKVYYEERAGQYDDWYHHINLYDDPENNEAWRAEVERLSGWVQAFGQGRVLEIASGTGWWTRFLARRAAVTTLDYSPAMIAMLCRRLQENGVRADVTRGDAFHLPFAPAVFDCCFFGFWLSHMPSALLPSFFADIARVLRPGGQVMIVDSKPFRGEQPGAELKQERILNDGSRHHIVKVYHTPETLRALLEGVGVDVRTWDTGRFITVGTYRTGVV